MFKKRIRAFTFSIVRGILTAVCELTNYSVGWHTLYGFYHTPKGIAHDWAQLRAAAN